MATAITITDHPAAGAVFFTDRSGEVFPMLYEDIRSLIQVSKVAYTFAQAQAARHYNINHSQAAQNLAAALQPLNGVFQRPETATPQPAHPINSARTAFQALLQNDDLNQHGAFTKPLPGSTAHFGMFFIPPGEPNTHAQKTSVLDRLVPQAHAVGGLEIMAVGASKMVTQLMRFAVISGVALVVSVIAKYTVLKKRLHKKRGCEHALATGDENAPPLPLNTWGKVSREVKEIGDVYAHSLTVLAQLPGVWFGNTLEHLGDRFAPKLFAGSHSRIRRMLDKSVYFIRDVSRRVPVSAYTFFLGALVLGSVDTVLYYVQLYHLVPSLAQGLGELVPALKSRIEEAYAIGNANTGELNRYAVVQCAISYFTSGAASMSMDLRGQFIDSVKAEVDAELRQQGHDPLDPTLSTRREQLIDQRLEATLVRMGLPGKESFLFDAQSLYNGVLKTLGYDLPQEYQALDEEEKSAYMGLERPGLVIPSVKAALRVARERAERARALGGYDEQATQAAVELQKLSDNLSLLRQFLRQPGVLLRPGTFRQVLNQWRDTKRQLIALTYAGQNTTQMDDSTSSSATATSTLSAQLFRRAFFSFLSGNPAELAPSATIRKNAGPVAVSRALESLISQYSDEWQDLSTRLGEASARMVFVQHHHEEYDRAVDQALLQIEEDRKSLRSGRYTGTHYEPTHDWLGRRQERRILQRANELYLAEAGAPFDAHGFNGQGAPATEWARWHRLYAQAYMQTLGLQADDTALAKGLAEGAQNSASSVANGDANDGIGNDPMTILQSSHRIAARTLEQQLAADPALKAHLDQLPPDQRARYSALLYAQAVVQSYIQQTWFNEGLSPLSTAQPGRLQRLRQTALFRGSPALTRAARVVEALFGDHSYELGLRSALSRSLPGYADFRLSNSRAYRGAFSSAAAYYPFNQYFWGVTLSPAFWALNLMARFTITAPTQYLNRMFRMLGLKPMSNAKNMILFGVIFAFATFWGSIPMQIFSGDFLNAWNTVAHWAQQPFILLRDLFK
jgi:hypothetical protein